MGENLKLSVCGSHDKTFTDHLQMRRHGRSFDLIWFSWDVPPLRSCPYVGNCVGRENYRWFFGYAFLFFVCSSLWEVTAFLYLRTVEWSAAVAVVAVLFLPFWTMSVMLTSFHVQLTLTNMTTNESMNAGRYEYLSAGQNKFDKGMLNNFFLRFFPPDNDGTVDEIKRLMSDVEIV
jgi:hypothetical protein